MDKVALASDALKRIRAICSSQNFKLKSGFAEQIAADFWGVPVEAVHDKKKKRLKYDRWGSPHFRKKD